MLIGIGLDFAFQVIRHRGTPPWPVRTRWLQRSSARVLRVFKVRVQSHGAHPRSGLLVSNHLSYLDILVLVSLLPAVFVSKAEVRNWPVFGWCARMAGTLFIDRTRRSDVGRMTAEMKTILDAGQVVVLFPEGTSSSGRDVLPFRSSLLEPACGSQHPLTVSHVRYELEDGSVEEDVCYWRDMTFLPHLVRLMTRKQIHAEVRFAPVTQRAADRKELALQLHAEVVRLKAMEPADTR